MNAALLPFGHPAEVPLTAPAGNVNADDLQQACLLFLGMPPPQALKTFREDVAGLLRILLASEEFHGHVLTPVLLREPLPAKDFPGAPSQKLIGWIQERMPLSPFTRSACALARTWNQLLEVLLADAQLAALSEDLVQAGAHGILRARMDSEPHWRKGREVSGSLDNASAFEVMGWAVDVCNKTVPVELEFFADATLLGKVRCDQPRPDVADVMGCQSLYGFRFQISAAQRQHFGKGSLLRAVDSVSRQPVGQGVMVYADVAHPYDLLATTRLEVTRMRETLERLEARLPQLTAMASLPLEGYDAYWNRFYKPVPSGLRAQRQRGQRFAWRPLFSVVMPTYCPDLRLLSLAIDSVLGQSYEAWELIISDDASPDQSALEVLQRHYAHETRIRWITGPHNAGIAVNTNRALSAAGGDYVAFLDHDDELAPHALHCCAQALQNKHYTLLYSDEDRIESDEFGHTRHHTPFFKPGFDPDLLLGLNYICHLVVARRTAVQALYGLRSACDGAQDHDFLLRLTQALRDDEICHIPQILYHWRVTPGSVSNSPARVGALQETIVAVVADHLAARGDKATVTAHTDPFGSPRLFATRVRWELPLTAPKVSIIIPTRDRMELLGPCVDSVLAHRAHYPGETEILIADNDSCEAATLAYFARIEQIPGVRRLLSHGAFNYSAINNQAAEAALGEVLIFLNNDTLVIHADWCHELVSQALRADVGAVGARLLYADGSIQHAGVLMGVEGAAGHEAVGEFPAHGGYFGRSHLPHSASAVTAACMAMRKSVFEEVGGFDALHLKVAFNDTDLCLKVRQAGYRVVYTPFATLNHFESKSRGRELSAQQQERHRAEALTLSMRWSSVIARDPYYNPHFERYAQPFSRLRCPEHETTGPHP